MFCTASFQVSAACASGEPKNRYLNVALELEVARRAAMCRESTHYFKSLHVASILFECYGYCAFFKCLLGSSAICMMADN